MSCLTDHYFSFTMTVTSNFFSLDLFVVVQSLSHIWLFATPWSVACQASLSFTISWILHKLMSIESWCHPTVSSSVIPFSLAFNLSQHQGLFQWVSSSPQVAKELELQHQSCQWIFRTDFFQAWLIWSPCSPRDSQESSTSQFKSICSSASVMACFFTCLCPLSFLSSVFYGVLSTGLFFP